jgi:DNA-binding XRE family transcriptional regulator
MSPKTLELGGKRYVVIEEQEYLRLKGCPTLGRGKMVRMPNGQMVETFDALKVANLSIARRIRTYRKKAGMGQLELATAAGVRPETVSRIERGEGNPTVGTIEKLIRAMGLDPETA